MPARSTSREIYLTQRGLGGVSAPRSRGIVDLFMLLGVLALMSLSNYALDYFGIPYDSAGGSILTKIHPATFIFAAGLMLALIANRNPFLYALDLSLRCLGSIFLLVGCLLLWFFISRYKTDESASFLIDALMAASLITMLFADAGEHARLNAARVVHLVMTLNCVIAIVEGLTGWRLFPFAIDGRLQLWDHRSTALLGHPLNGALITGVYAVMLMTVPTIRGLADRWRVPLIFLCMITMPFLGARTSFAVVYAMAVAVALLAVWRFLRGGSIGRDALVKIAILVPLGMAALGLMLQLGLFDNFLDRFSNDSGSATTRVLLFKLFDNFDLHDLLVGENHLDLDTSVRLAGLEEGIESSWAGHLLRYGAPMSLVLWFGVAGWFADMLRAGGKRVILPLVFIFLVISTSVGISGKTNMVTVPTVLILALIAKAPRDEAHDGDDDLFARVRASLAE